MSKIQVEKPRSKSMFENGLESKIVFQKLLQTIVIENLSKGHWQITYKPSNQREDVHSENEIKVFTSNLESTGWKIVG